MEVPSREQFEATSAMLREVAQRIFGFDEAARMRAMYTRHPALFDRADESLDVQLLQDALRDNPDPAAKWLSAPDRSTKRLALLAFVSLWMASYVCEESAENGKVSLPQLWAELQQATNDREVLIACSGSIR